jgi:hypothetical protein
MLGRYRPVSGHAAAGECRSDEEQSGKERDDGDDGELGWHVPLVPMVREMISPANAGAASMAACAEMAQTY